MSDTRPEYETVLSLAKVSDTSANCATPPAYDGVGRCLTPGPSNETVLSFAKVSDTCANCATLRWYEEVGV